MKIEKMKWAEELKKEYSRIANENMTRGIALSSNEQKVHTRDKVVEELGMSSTVLGKAQYIYNNAPEDIIGQLDDGQLSINKAYITLREQLKSEKEKLIS